MKPAPYTWEFQLIPLDAKGDKFLENARCCLRGDKQVAYESFDLHTLYAPVSSLDYIRYLVAISAAEGSELKGADISNAYLYGDLDMPIIMEQPTDSS